MEDYTTSSGNIFKDLGFPNPDEELAKVKLASKINHLTADQGMTQKEASQFLGISRLKMTSLRNGRLGKFSIDLLFSLLGKLDHHKVTIMKEVTMRPKPGIETIQPYQGGKPIEEVQRELGISDIIKLASNENPLGPSPLAMSAIQDAATQVNLYPDGNAYYLKQDLAAHVGVPPENLILGNGSNEVLQLVGETYISLGDEVIYSESAFVVYMLVAKVFGAKSIITPMSGYTQDLAAMADAITDQTRVIFIANPNNPTGTMVTKTETEKLMERVPDDVLVVFDEAYYEYVDRPDYPQTLPYIHEGRNVIITRTFSKIYGLAGMRIGYGLAKPDIIETMNRVRQPFNCNLVAQAAARAALKDAEHVRRSQEVNAIGKAFLYEALDKMGLAYVESEGNFILVHFDRSGNEISDALMRKGVIVRPVAGYGFPNSIRVTIGTPKENERFVKGLKAVLADK